MAEMWAFSWYISQISLVYNLKEKVERQGLKIHWLPSFIGQAGCLYPLWARAGAVEGQRTIPLLPWGGRFAWSPAAVISRDGGAWSLLVQPPSLASLSVLLKSLPLESIWINWSNLLQLLHTVPTQRRTAGHPGRDLVPLKDLLSKDVSAQLWNKNTPPPSPRGSGGRVSFFALHPGMSRA